MLALLEACVPDYDWTFWIELWSLALRDERASALRIELDERFRDVIEEIVRDGVEAASSRCLTRAGPRSRFPR